MSVLCTWDPRKAASNARKHGVRFDEASTVFDDPDVLIEGQEHANEYRLVAIGYSIRQRLLLVIFAEVIHGKVRIISARRAEKGERKAYEAKDP
jgi:uncharacterized DUF497 family protein